MSHERNNKRGLQEDYLIAEKNKRERLTKQYVDGSYTWAGGFD
jgi:hypothetical protein